MNKLLAAAALTAISTSAFAGVVEPHLTADYLDPHSILNLKVWQVQQQQVQQDRLPDTVLGNWCLGFNAYKRVNGTKCSDGYPPLIIRSNTYEPFGRVCAITDSKGLGHNEYTNEDFYYAHVRCDDGGFQIGFRVSKNHPDELDVKVTLDADNPYRSK